MGERLFTPAEANATLGTLRPLLESAVRHLRELTEGRGAASLQGLRGGNGGGAAARVVGEAGERLRADIDAVEALGVVLKDPSAGLVDFPAVHDGIEVYLCWRLGEEEVGWWHPRDTGFAGRRPIDW